MKIGLAQIQSTKGALAENIQAHLKMAQQAAAQEAELIVFPELSITNYEPSLARELAVEINDPIFLPFQALSDANDLTIGIGVPTRSPKGIKISMLIFQAGKKRTIYSKQLLHADELPYFVCGDQSVLLEIKEMKIGLGICYESLQREHFLAAKDSGMDIFVASVAKSQSGIEKAYTYFPSMAAEFGIPILMANGVGPCEGFVSAGQSAAWDKTGELVGQLDTEDGLLFFEMITS